MKKRKIQKSLLDTTFVNPILPVVKKNTVYETDKELIARLQREEAAERDAKDPVLQAKRQHTQTLVKLQNEAREYWSQSISELSKTWSKSERAKDITFSVPAIRDSYSLDDARAAFNIFVDQQLPKTAYSLTEASGTRLTLFGLAQAQVGGQDMSNPKAWSDAFDHLLNVLKAFQPGELIVDESKLPKPIEQAPKKQTLDEVLNSHSGETTEGRKAMIKAVEDSLINREWANCWLGFTTSIYENFDGYMLTKREKDTFIETMIRRNLSLNCPAHYDSVRVALVKSGDLGKGFPHLLYPSEVLSAQMEDADLNDREVRRQIAQRTRQLQTA
jgi:hypothetical protein